MPPDRPGAAAWLQKLQLAAYRGQGLEPPPAQPETVKEWAAASLDALRDGGPWDEALAALPPEQGGDPAVRARLLAERRDTVEQYARRSADEEQQAAHAAAPSPYIAPNHALILHRMQQRVETLGRDTPDLAGRLKELSGHVLVSTLPTGELNAQTVAVRGLPDYLILFDPVFFDIIDCFSDFVSRAIDGQAMRKAAYEYGQSGIDIDLTTVMRGEDRTVVGNCLATLRALLFRGVPPPRITPRPEGSENLAGFLRETAGLFVTAHEYGHVLLRHPDPGGPAAGIPRTDKEFAADRIACGIVMAYGDSVGSIRTERFLGTHFFLVSVLLIEAIRTSMARGQPCRISDVTAFREPRPEDTHPSTSLRLAYVNQWLEERYPPKLFRGTQFFAAVLLELADRLLACVQPALLAQAASGQALVSGWFETRPKIEPAAAA